MQLTDAHERVKATKLAEKAKEDIFLRMCEINHMEAVEREARATVTAAALEPQQLGNSEQLDGGAEYGEFMQGLCNGILLGIVIALIVVWVIALVRGGAA
nr:MAG TPA: hypothetical protein [Caudoviricetes sp.]